MKRSAELRWWTAPREDVAQHVVSLVQKLWEWDEPRRQRLERAARLYGPGLSLGRWQNGPGLGALSMNVVRSLVQTASSSLLQIAPPRPWFLTDGADPETQDRAKGMTKLTTGVLYKTEFDAQARGDTLLSACLGGAATKIFERDGEPCLERVMAWSLLVDERDGYDQKPRSIYQVCWVDRDVLRAQYLGHTRSPEETAENDEAPEEEDEERGQLVQAIEEAGTCGMDDDFEYDGSTDQVCVLEAWHLPSRRGAKDGRHTICTDKGLLLDEPWQDDHFPFAFFHWQTRLTGFWSPGIADEIWTIQYEINLTIERIRQMLHTVAVPRIWIEESTKLRPSPMTNRIGGVHYYRGAKPVFETAQAVSPELWNYLEYLWAKAFQLLGISELAASAMKPSGVDSGKAMRVYADLTSGRMNGWSRNWLDYYLAVCKQLVRLMRRLSKSGRKGEVIYLDTRRKRLERVAWKDVALEDDEYVIQCFPVSSLPSSPTGRLQQLDEWRNGGLIDDYAYRKLLDLPDLDGEMGLLNAPREAIEMAMHEMLRGDGRYVAPTSFDDLALALRVGNLHYLQARNEGLPPERLALVDRYLVEAKRLKIEAEAALAPPVPPAPPGMPPGLPPPGAAPPGAMPPPLAPPAALPAAA